MVRRLLLIILCLPLGVLAQNDQLRSLIIEQRVESLAESLEEDGELDYTTLVDDLMFFFEHPLNLNQASVVELQRLHLLSDLQIQGLLRHIDRHGKLTSIYELQAIEGWDIEVARRIEPFTRVGDESAAENITFSNLINEGQHDLFIRYTRILEEQQGFSPISSAALAENPNRRYLGSPDRYYLRYRYKFRNNLSFGFTTEKDPGEEFFSGSQSGMDFYSAHLQYQGKGLIRNIMVGDFQAQFGQGLTMWSGLGFGKSSYTMQVKRIPGGLRPYTSVDENVFMRGGGITLGWKALEFTAFVSAKNVDGNLSESDTLDTEVLTSFTSLQLTGFHRTPGELTDKDAIDELHIGGHLGAELGRLKIGATGFRAKYDAEFDRNLSLYNQFELDTNEYSVLGIDYNYGRYGLNFFGEASRSDNGGMAFLNGVMLALHPRLSVSAVHRKFDRDYHNLQSTVFGESTRPANESGLYLGMEAALSQQWKLSAYYDQFRFPWLRFLNDAPTQGSEYLAQLTFKPSRNSQYYVRYRHRLRARNASGDQIIDFPVPENRYFFRVHAQYKVSESFRFKTRVEWSRYHLDENDAENGFMFFHDVIFKKMEWPISLAVRYALFDTDSYNARIYAYENDLLYTWNIPAYYSRGSRFYAMVKWDVYRKVDLWLRYSVWSYNDREEIGSGLNQINGNTKSELKAQLRIRF